MLTEAIFRCVHMDMDMDEGTLDARLESLCRVVIVILLAFCFVFVCKCMVYAYMV